MFTREIIPGFYQMTFRYANMFLAVEKSLTLIDTGFRGSMPGVFEFIRRLGRQPEEIGLVILTHNHLDHTGGLEELRRAVPVPRVAAHWADLFMPDGQIPYPAGGYVGMALRSPLLRPLKRRLVLDKSEVNVRLEGGEVFDVLGGLQVVPTPGHTAGSISLYSASHRLLIVADAVNKRGDVLRMPLKTVSTNLKDAAASIRKMAALDVGILCSGHGRPIMHDANANLKTLVAKLDAVGM